ncbi:13755_t:CDS:2, partial [Racocetra persica]
LSSLPGLTNQTGASACVVNINATRLIAHIGGTISVIYEFFNDGSSPSTSDIYLLDISNITSYKWVNLYDPSTMIQALPSAYTTIIATAHWLLLEFPTGVGKDFVQE